MERTELTKLLSHISDIYRQFEFPKETSNDTKRFIESWAEYLGEYEYELAREALKNFTGKHPKWPPNAPELHNFCQDIVDHRQRLDWAKKQEKAIEQGAGRQQLPEGKPREERITGGGENE